MTSEVVAEIEAQVSQLRAAGQVPPGLEDELDRCFEDVAEVSLAAAGRAMSGVSGPAADPIAGSAGPMSLAQLRKQATTAARRLLGPSFRRLERRGALGVARLGEAASIRAHVTVDHLERLAARSPWASRRPLSSSARRGGSVGCRDDAPVDRRPALGLGSRALDCRGTGGGPGGPWSRAARRVR